MSAPPAPARCARCEIAHLPSACPEPPAPVCEGCGHPAHWKGCDKLTVKGWDCLCKDFAPPPPAPETCSECGLTGQHASLCRHVNRGTMPAPSGRMSEEEFERLAKTVLLNRPGYDGQAPRTDLVAEARRAREEEKRLEEEPCADNARLREAIRWVTNDARYKAPEQIGIVAERWIDRLKAALEKP